MEGEGPDDAAPFFRCGTAASPSDGQACTVVCVSLSGAAAERTTGTEGCKTRRKDQFITLKTF